MESITFDKLLLNTAFFCMASDGHIDTREILLIKSMCESNPLLIGIRFQDEINRLVNEINAQGKEFVRYYFDLLSKTVFTEQEELTLIDIAIKTIKADEQIEYSEIKFFKNIRLRLKISNEAILKTFPDIEMFLEEDIATEPFLDKIAAQYLDEIEIPRFELLAIDMIPGDSEDI
jgi:hypothetical protein